MTFATHNYLPGRSAHWGRRLSESNLTSASRKIGVITRLPSPEKEGDYLTCAITMERGNAEAELVGATAGDLVFTKPGTRKSNGETVREALIPPQPVISPMTVQMPTARTTLRITVEQN